MVLDRSLPTTRLSGWSRYPVLDCAVLPVRRPEDAAMPAGHPVIARGNGRSYGDASLGVPTTLAMRPLDRFLAFDEATGVLSCEAGVLLSDIVDVFTPRGWFPAVTPGTRFVTVGGAIAADVHGKNHHGAGSFGAHVIDLDLALGDGRIVTCSRDAETDLFLATLGGMGLTGVILAARLRLQPIRTATIRQTTHRVADLDGALERLAGSTSTYSVAWIDCLASGASLGRSVVMDGEHAEPEELPAGIADPLARTRRRGKTVPFDFPALAISGPTVKAFNALYYRRHRNGTGLVDLDSYFYPLDALLEWHRIYGSKGFLQYQFVVPLAGARAALVRILGAIAEARSGSFLAVLKQFGPEGEGHLSFPMEGLTLALDFPASPDALALLDRLDDLVLDAGGRIYLAKDARMKPALLAAGYPRLPLFRAVRARHGLEDRFQSALSRRLGL